MKTKTRKQTNKPNLKHEANVHTIVHEESQWRDNNPLRVALAVTFYLSHNQRLPWIRCVGVSRDRPIARDL